MVDGASARDRENGTGLATGTVDRVLFRNPETGYAVVRLRGEGQAAGETLVGHLPPLSPGETVRASGVWRNDPTWGRQLRVERLTVLGESDSTALSSYLASGVVPGVGPALAARIVERFGELLPEVMTEAGHRLEEVPGIGRKLRAKIVEGWQAARRERDLLLFLHGHGLGGGRARAILGAYGERAIERLRENPYALARDVRGVGFHTADEFARRLGFADDDPARRAAGLEHCLRLAEDEGDCALPLPELVRRGGELLGQDEALIEAAAELAIAEGVLVRTRVDGTDYVQTARLANAETAVAARLLELAGATPPWAVEPAAALDAAEAALGLELAGSQRAAVAAALQHRLLVITGGPGTGKTTLVRAILAALDAAGVRCLLAAPTGRAAKRLAESTGLEARTLHRLLEAEPGRGFRRHRGRRLEADLVVCDECSMVDIGLAEALLAALPEHAALLLVGDADQLPSVGPGQVLADIIASDVVPVVALTEIFRQAAQSAIVRNAHAVNRGELPGFEHDASGLGDFYGVRADGPDDAIRKVEDLLALRIPERFGLDPMSEVQVLVPTNRGTVGTVTLNAALAARLNPDPPESLARGDRRYAVGDKVMQTENDYERDVYNGDIGRILAIDGRNRSLDVLIDERRVVYGFDALDQLAPAFAVTVHKAQGSEYPAVVVILLRQHGRMLRRRLFYTAITRAKRLVVVVAEPAALERAVRDFGERPRLTLLEHRLRARSTRT